MTERGMTTQQAADYLDISVKTLYNWRYEGKAPPARKLNGGNPRYRKADIDNWLKQKSILEKPRKLG